MRDNSKCEHNAWVVMSGDIKNTNPFVLIDLVSFNRARHLGKNYPIRILASQDSSHAP